MKCGCPASRLGRCVNPDQVALAGLVPVAAPTIAADSTLSLAKAWGREGLFIFQQNLSNVGRVGAERRIETIRAFDFDTPRQDGATQSTSSNPAFCE